MFVRGIQKQSFFLQTLLFTAFLVGVLEILAYALVSTWSSVSSGWEHVKRKMHPCHLIILMFRDENQITYCYSRVSRRKWEIENYFSLSKNQADSSENSWDREFQFCCGLNPIGVIFDKDINIQTTTYTWTWAHYWQPHKKESEIKKRLLKCDQSADGHHHGHHLIHNYKR